MIYQAAERLKLIAATPFTTRQRQGWWFWLLMMPVLLLAALWWWMQGQTEEKPRPVGKGRLELQPGAGDGKPPVVKEPVSESTPVTEPDDLRRIEGIGPKIAAVLATAGLSTYDQLAEASVEQLRQTLRQAQVRANPSSWPEQAKLAADGAWDELEVLQNQLQGGRRI